MLRFILYSIIYSYWSRLMKWLWLKKDKLNGKCQTNSTVLILREPIHNLKSERTFIGWFLCQSNFSALPLDSSTACVLLYALVLDSRAVEVGGALASVLLSSLCSEKPRPTVKFGCTNQTTPPAEASWLAEACVFVSVKFISLTTSFYISCRCLSVFDCCLYQWGKNFWRSSLRHVVEQSVRGNQHTCVQSG